MEAGALDVTLTPIIMKKGRPAQLLTVIASLDLSLKLEQIIFEELPTLGIRKICMQRSILVRKAITVDSEHGPLPGKKIYEQDGSERIVTEFDAQVEVANAKGTSVRKLFQE